MKSLDVLWLQTRTGRAVHLLETSPSDIYVQDIAAALSRAARFNGHTIGSTAYSVAQHSMFCAQAMPAGTDPGLRLAVLLHDAHEAYTGDFPSPIKWAIEYILQASGCDANPIEVIQDSLQSAIHYAIGLDFRPEWRAAIKEIDYTALAVEKRHLMAREPKSWGSLPDVSRIAMQPIPVPEAEAAAAFMHALRRCVAAAGVTPLACFGL